MSDSSVISEVRKSAGRGTVTPRSFLDRSLVQLTLVRFREFWREPEAVFWVFIFPILLAAGLGLAFRNRPAEASRIAIVRAAERLPVADSLKKAPGLKVDVLDDTAAATALRTGTVALVVSPRADGGVDY